MTWCGYHPKMTSGLHEFAAGLAAAVIGRGERTGFPMTEIKKLEQAEMNSLNAELRKQQGSARKEALEGLSLFVGSVFKNAAKRSDVPFDVAIEEEVRAVAALIEPMERESKRIAGAGGTMADLAAWVARQ